MSSRGWAGTGVMALLFAIVIGLMGVGTAPNINDHLRKNYEASGGGTYRCHGTPQQVGEEIAQKTRPQAQKLDLATGIYYLRYNKNLVIVSPTGSTGCSISVEDSGRVNGGSFIYLGPGFGPSAPSGSSGGSSGSSGGVK